MTKQADGPRGPVSSDSEETLGEDEGSPPTPPAVTREDGSLADGRSITYYWLEEDDGSE